jgi:integrative and conjugative element protein (TIGR02256 family)
MADGFPSPNGRGDEKRILGRWLEANLSARPLETREVPFDQSDGWCFVGEFAGKELRLIYSVNTNARDLSPRISLADPPDFPSWPHVEIDGRLCILSSVDEIDRSKPIEVAEHLLKAAIKILEDGLSGRNVDDFRTEFLSYWNPCTSGSPVTSTLDPSGPTRVIARWRTQNVQVVAENKRGLRDWLKAGLGKEVFGTREVDRALLVWLERPMLPGEYPTSSAAVRKLVDGAGEQAREWFDGIVANMHRDCLVLFGAPTDDGVCFAAVKILRDRERLNSSVRPPKRKRRRLSRVANLKAQGIERLQVNRADAPWIHGRDSNHDLQELSTMTVGLIGCGSLGSQVARMIALAGVGEIIIIDPQNLEWSNVGRHVLGSNAVGTKKASSMALRLQRDFPHSNFISYPDRWQKRKDALVSCDLLISTLGGWSDEADLNEWQVKNKAPPILYGWSERAACAGHAVILGIGSGCLACGFDAVGTAKATVTRWAEPGLLREPACGALFQPYGAISITSIATVVADLAIDQLLKRAPPNGHRITSTSEASLQRAGGSWSADWIAICGEDAPGGRVIDLAWAQDPQVSGLQRGMISFTVGTSDEIVVFDDKVLAHLHNHRQTRFWHREAGGLLFARIDGRTITVEEATGPRRSDRRSRFSYSGDRIAEQLEIESMFERGLHYVGDWHTHPEGRPTPSARDDETMGTRVHESQHTLQGFLFVIMGFAPLPEGLAVVVHDGIARYPLHLAFSYEQPPTIQKY